MCYDMGLLPDMYKCGLGLRRECQESFPATTGKWSRNASRHLRDARAVMHIGIAD